MLSQRRLAIQNIHFEDVIGLTSCYSMLQTWREASCTKKFLMVGGSFFALSAAAVAVGFGVPPHVLTAFYHVASLIKTVYEVGKEFCQSVAELFSRPKPAKPSCAVLPFMQTIQAQEEARQLEAVPMAAAAA
ncbi:MAG: hypothetical protein K0R66_1473 [Gammaproteobacteria bacterium]|jgi:hypothetical protein|nr:hypothetical protein [Gammaproteobacteria bacterium]